MDFWESEEVVLQWIGRYRKIREREQYAGHNNLGGVLFQLQSMGQISHLAVLSLYLGEDSTVETNEDVRRERRTES